MAAQLGNKSVQHNNIEEEKKKNLLISIQNIKMNNAIPNKFELLQTGTSQKSFYNLEMMRLVAATLASAVQKLFMLFVKMMFSIMWLSFAHGAIMTALTINETSHLSRSFGCVPRPSEIPP